MERRQFLKTTGALAAVGATGLSGCTGILGGGGDFDDVSEWLPAPSLLDSDLDHYWTIATSPSSLDEEADALSSEQWDSYRGEWVEMEYANPLADEIDLVVSTFTGAGGFRIVEGDFDADRIDANILDDDFSRDREYGGYETYESGDESTAYAVDDETVISANVGGDALEWVQYVIDAKDGEVDRYDDANPDFDDLESEMDVGHFSYTLTQERTEETDPASGQFENMVAEGYYAEVGSDETEITQVMVFIDEGSVFERDIEDYVDEYDEFDNFREVDYEIDGNVVTVTGSQRTRDFEF